MFEQVYDNASISDDKDNRLPLINALLIDSDYTIPEVPPWLLAELAILAMAIN